MVARLILHAEALNLSVTFGDAYRDPRAHFPYSHPKSLHAQRLAVDLNVFRNGTLASGADMTRLGEYWESLGGAWGGRFDLDGDGEQGDDPGHFSLAHNGMR